MSTLRAMTSGPAIPTVSSRAQPLTFCGIRGWEEVSVHEVMASFLQSEWYKEEHAEWRSDARAHAAVIRPNISDDNDNVLRAMLLATPRKVPTTLATLRASHLATCSAPASSAPRPMTPHQPPRSPRRFHAHGAPDSPRARRSA